LCEKAQKSFRHLTQYGRLFAHTVLLNTGAIKEFLDFNQNHHNQQLEPTGVCKETEAQNFLGTSPTPGKFIGITARRVSRE
jgi:hypothetical protein